MVLGRRAEIVLGLVVPLLLIVVLAVIARGSEQPASWIAFLAAVPMFSAMFTRVLMTGVVALVAVLTAGVVAAQALGGQFVDALPVLVGVIAFSGAAVLVAQAKSAPVPRPRQPEPLGQLPAVPPDEPEPTVDALTGLPTREGVLALLADDAAASQPCVVGFIDVDGIATVNRDHGRDIGDIFLFAVGGRTRYALPEGDLVARWGDDEFLFVIHGSGSEVDSLVRHIADKVNQNPIRTGSGLVPATMCVGAVSWAPGTPVETALADARRALYRAKAMGAGSCVAPADL